MPDTLPRIRTLILRSGTEAALQSVRLDVAPHPTAPMADGHHPARSFYDRISGVYDLIADAGEHEARELGLELLAITPGERVLEIGFGTGHSLEALARAAGEEGHVAGIDISNGMLRQATKRLEGTGLAHRIELTCAAVPPLPYPDGTFDAVSMSFTLELFELERIPEVLAETARVLVPGGRLGVVSMALPRPDERESLLERGYQWMHRHFPHIVDCQPIEAERFVEEAGFALTQARRIDLFTMPVAVLVGGVPSSR